MSPETEATLRKSLDAIDSMRRRVYVGGWLTVVFTLGLYARLSYLHQTTDSLEKLLGASVAALTGLIAWTSFAIILIVIRTAKRILRALEVLARNEQAPF
ncbi:MAG TPA: hypothetical protein VMW27_29320 [Thermoanaerobaculia bacterium]|nr:hypothetical protein [Thermoanaerobaculia bacterium]